MSSQATPETKLLDSLTEGEMKTLVRGARKAFAEFPDTDDAKEKPKAALEEFEPVTSGEDTGER